MNFMQLAQDAAKEQDGVVVDFDLFRVTLARAGGSNKKFGKMLAKAYKPIRKAVDMGMVSDERVTAIFADAYADTVIKKWEVKQADGAYKVAMHSPAGEIVDFTRENVVALLTHESFHDLFLEIQQAASDAERYRQAAREIDSGN